MTKSKKLRIALMLYCVALYLIWSVLELLIVPKIQLQETSLAMEVIKEIILKTMIWFIPAIILTAQFDEFMYIKKKEIFHSNLNFIKYIPIFLIFTLYHLIAAYVQNGHISVRASFGAVDLLLALSVGLSEEMVFRGWLLNSALKERKKWGPILVNAVLFLIIHVPIWIRSGLFLSSFASGAFLQIIALSILFSWTFIKSRSLVIPAALHMYWDFLCFLL